MGKHANYLTGMTSWRLAVKLALGAAAGGRTAARSPEDNAMRHPVPGVKITSHGRAGG